MQFAASLSVPLPPPTTEKKYKKKFCKKIRREKIRGMGQRDLV
jgi:hypothetical protein